MNLNISLFKHPNFKWVYLIDTNPELRKVGDIRKIMPRDFLPYLEVHLNYPALGVMII